jgi:hypothetical protein
MLAYSIAPARRDGVGWGRQAPRAPPPQASPSPTCSGWGVSGTVVELNGDSLDPVHGLVAVAAAAKFQL